MMASYMLFAYTDLFTDIADLVMMGWISTGIMGANILINLIFMTCDSSHTAKLKCKRCINRCKGKCKARREAKRRKMEK